MEGGRKKEAVSGYCKLINLTLVVMFFLSRLKAAEFHDDPRLHVFTHFMRFVSLAIFGLSLGYNIRIIHVYENVVRYLKIIFKLAG